MRAIGAFKPSLDCVSISQDVFFTKFFYSKNSVENEQLVTKGNYQEISEEGGGGHLTLFNCSIDWML